jgi:hypothetical protein
MEFDAIEAGDADAAHGDAVDGVEVAIHPEEQGAEIFEAEDVAAAYLENIRDQMEDMGL